MEMSAMEKNQRLLIGVALFAVGIPFYLFVPCFGTLLCTVSWAAGLVLIIMALSEKVPAAQPQPKPKS